MSAQIKGHNKSGKDNAVHIITGKDKFLVNSALDSLVDELLAEEHRQLALFQPTAQTSAADIFDELRTRPFLAPYKVVLIKDADEFITNNRELLESYFDNPSPCGILILVTTTFRSKTRLARKLPSIGVLHKINEPKPYQLASFVTGYIKKKHGKTISSSAAKLLVETVGHEPGRLAAEADKLTLYSAGKKSITEADINALVGDLRSFGAFEVIDAMTAGNIPSAMTRMRNMFAADKGNEFRVIGAFAYQFRKMFQAKTMLDNGVDRTRVAKAVNIWPQNRQHAFFRLINKLTLREIAKLHSQLADIDYETKTGRTTVKVAIEKLVLSLAAA
jgi:DNA polymerase-3 subunit delta